MRFLLCALPLFFLGLVAAQYSSTKVLQGTCFAGGVAVDSRAGTLFATCSTGNSIMAWPNSAASGTVLLGAGQGCTYPQELVWNAARGSLFAACNGYPSSSSAIVQITQVNSTVTAEVLPANYANCGVHFVYVDVDNSVYGTCDSTGVLKWTDVTKTAVKLSDDNGYCMYSRQIAVNPVTGDVFLACMGGTYHGQPYPSRVLRWAPGASTASIFSSTCGMAQGAVVGGNGDLYVGCGSDNNVVKFAFNAATHQYSTTAQQLNGTCHGSDGVNLKWASNGLFATCVTENAVKFWSLSALNTNSAPVIISSGTPIEAAIAVSTYGETVLSATVLSESTVLEWQLL